MNGKRRESVPDCRCDQTEGEMHPCPYSEEIADVHDDVCDCCPACESECCMDI